MIAALAIVLERPVKWVETRREHMVATVHAREQTHHIEMALTNDGEILGVRDTIYANLGMLYPLGRRSWLRHRCSSLRVQDSQLQGAALRRRGEQDGLLARTAVSERPKRPT